MSLREWQDYLRASGAPETTIGQRTYHLRRVASEIGGTPASLTTHQECPLYFRPQLLHHRRNGLLLLFASGKLLASRLLHCRHAEYLTKSSRRVFSARVTTSKWEGLTHRRTRHRWSMVSPAGIGPTYSS